MVDGWLLTYLRILLFTYLRSNLFEVTLCRKRCNSTLRNYFFRARYGVVWFLVFIFWNKYGLVWRLNRDFEEKIVEKGCDFLPSLPDIPVDDRRRGCTWQRASVGMIPVGIMREKILRNFFIPRALLGWLFISGSRRVAAELHFAHWPPAGSPVSCCIVNSRNEDSADNENE